MDTFLYDVSIPLISRLQSSLTSDEFAGPMTSISHIFDPKYAFLFCAPLAYLLDKRLGKQLILVVVLAEWANQCLKWLLHGHRPYWYVHERGLSADTPIRQFPSTCEMGPGHPSGHAMLTAALWHVLLAYGRKKLIKLRNNSNLISGTEDDDYARRYQDPLIKSIYLGILVTVSLSRVYLACHFPHQCLLGALLGYSLASFVLQKTHKLLGEEDLEDVEKLQSDWNVGKAFSMVGVFVFASALATFSLLEDPNWTLALASEHCERREYLHLDTAPLFSLMRYSGFAMGAGLGLQLKYKMHSLLERLQRSNSQQNLEAATSISNDESQPAKSTKQVNRLLVSIICVILLARLIDNLSAFVSPAANNTWLYYPSGLLAYATLSFAVVCFN